MFLWITLYGNIDIDIAVSGCSLALGPIMQPLANFKGNPMKDNLVNLEPNTLTNTSQKASA